MPNQSTEPPGSSDDGYDPLFVNARRELKVTLLAWLFFGIWVVGFSWVNGTREEADPATIRTILGIPAWVFWGVAVPWVAANFFTFWFCFGYMKDDPLVVVPGELKDEEEGKE